MTLNSDIVYIREALKVAANCRNIKWYGVGCIIVSACGEILATGYTGELLDDCGEMRHAEDIALEKALSGHCDLAEATLHSTLEPCSVRSSAKTPCVQRIINAGIQRVVYGAKEPYDPELNIVCEGELRLRAAGVKVTHLKELEQECLCSAVSKRG